MAFSIDPNLDRDNWAELARTRPDVFLHSLVTALSEPNPVSSAGPSVHDAFKAHLQSLAPGNNQSNNHNGKDNTIPALYSVLKTFWLPCSPSYFSLTSSAASSARIPSEHRFFYWDPQLLIFNGIFCPACNTPLINMGRISNGPIKVYDLGKPFFIIGCEYVCRSPTCIGSNPQGEGRKFASTDYSILCTLPPKLRDEFPAHLLVRPGVVPPESPDYGTGTDVWRWRDMGVSLGLWNMVIQSLCVGLQKDAIMRIVGAVNHGLSAEPWPLLPAPPALQPPQVKTADTSVDADADADGRAEGEEEEEEEEPGLNGDANKQVSRSTGMSDTHLISPPCFRQPQARSSNRRGTRTTPRREMGARQGRKQGRAPPPAARIPRWAHLAGRLPSTASHNIRTWRTRTRSTRSTRGRPHLPRSRPR